MSPRPAPIGLWSGRIPLLHRYGEASYYLQCSSALAALSTDTRWLLSGHESKAELHALRSRGITVDQPAVAWPPRRVTRAVRAPRCEWQYRNLRLVHYWSSTSAAPTGLPYVLTILDGIALGGRFGERGDLEATRRLAHRARAVMTLTWESADLLGELLGLNKSDLVPVGAGVDEQRFSAASDAGDQPVVDTYQLPSTYVLYLGGWAERKGLDALARALGHIDPDHRPVVALSGEPRTKDSALARDLRSLGAVTLGYVPDEHIPALLRKATALVVPALAEGFGLPVVEAQACGTPVVASDLPVLRSVSGEHCVFFPPGSAPAMARALLDTQTRPPQLIENGLRNARRHSWKTVAQRVSSVYAMALERPDAASASAARAG